ncbi:MAG: DUF3105 domain-containing protein [Nocardioides sp.]
MAKKPVKSDRQAVIEQIRKKQKGGEKRKGMMIVGVCVLIALLIVGAAAFKPIKDWWDGRAFDKLALEEIGAPASVCQDIVTKKAEGNQDHVPTGTIVNYTDAPPAFGAHWNESGIAPAPMDRKMYTAADRPELESLLHNLEHGYTILWYDETAADDADTMTEIRGIATKFEGTSNMRFKFKAVPWTDEDEAGKAFPDGQHIAYTHWSAGGVDAGTTGKQVGVWQYCSEPSGEALEDFMVEYPYLDSPEPNAM